MIPKLSAACYALRLIDNISNINTLISIYYAHFYSIRQYGIIFEDNSHNNGKIFTWHKKIIRIIDGVQLRSSCRSLYQQLEILPVKCQYILSLINFITNNQEIL